MRRNLDQIAGPRSRVDLRQIVSCYPTDRASRAVDVRVTPALKANSSLALREALLMGAGIAVIPRFVIADLAEGRLVLLLNTWRLPDHALFALHAGGRVPPAKVRKFVELLVEARNMLTDAKP